VLEQQDDRMSEGLVQGRSGDQQQSRLGLSRWAADGGDVEHPSIVVRPPQS
jgi:hypothetical protein